MEKDAEPRKKVSTKEVEAESTLARLLVDMAFAAFDGATGLVTTREVQQVKEQLLELGATTKKQKNTKQDSGVYCLGRKKSRTRGTLKGGSGNLSDMSDNEDTLESGDDQKTNEKKLIQDRTSTVSTTDAKETCLAGKGNTYGRNNGRKTSEDVRKAENDKSAKKHEDGDSDSDDDYKPTYRPGKRSAWISDSSDMEDEQERDEVIYPNAKGKITGEIKVQKLFQVSDALKLMKNTPENQLVKHVIQHEVKPDTVYVFDMRGSKYMWCLDDRVKPGDPIRDWLSTQAEARPRNAKKEDQLYVRKYILRDRGKNVNFWRTVYTDLALRNLKIYDIDKCQIKNILVHFHGSGNPNVTTGREKHGNKGRQYKSYGRNEIPGMQNMNNQKEIKERVSQGPVYEKKTEELKYEISEAMKSGKKGASLYGDLVLQAAGDSKTIRPARNIKQMYNSKEALKQQMNMFDDDMIDLAHMARTQGGKIIRQYNIYPFLLSTKHQGLQEHFSNVNKAGSGLTVHYDTTFNLGPRFVSILSVKHPWLLTANNQQPTIPVAALYHEGQQARRTHEPFFEGIAEDMPGFDNPKNVLITDREASIRKAVKNKFPNIKHVFCHNHIRRNLKHWTGKNFPSKEARRYRKQFKQLLFATDEDNLNGLLNKFCPGDERICQNNEDGINDEEIDKTIALSDSESEDESMEVPWEERMKDYYFKYQDKDVRQSYRGAFRSIGIFNKQSGITNNAAENINLVYQKTVLKNAKSPTQYECVQSMYKWQNRFYFDVGRGLKQTGGEYCLNTNYTSQANNVPDIKLDDHEIMFAVEDRKIITPEQIVKLEDYCNFDAKKTLALEILKLGLVKPVITAEGCKGYYMVETSSNKCELVYPKAKTCTCRNAKCEHKIAVAMLTGQFGDNPTLQKGSKEGTLTSVYEATKIRDVGKKRGQGRYPQAFDNAQDSVNNKQTDDNVDSMHPNVSLSDDAGDEGQDTSQILEPQFQSLKNYVLPKLTKENQKKQILSIGEVDVNLIDLKHIPENIEDDEAALIKGFIPGWFNDKVMYAYLYEISDKEKTHVINPIKTQFILEGSREKWVRDYLRKNPWLPDRTKLDLILMPAHVHGNHWILIAARRDNKLMVIDSKGTYKLTEKQKENIAAFLNYQYEKPVATLWTTELVNAALQNDGRSCGPFVCNYGKVLQNRGSLMEAPGKEFRQEVIQTIVGNCNIEKSLEMGGFQDLGGKQICNVCNKEEPEKDQKYRKGEPVNWLQCERCNAWWHNKCLKPPISRRDAKLLESWVCSK